MIESLFAPHTLEEFVTRYWGKEFLRVTGDPERFGDLMDWPVAERILQMSSDPRHSMVRGDHQLPPPDLYHDPFCWKSSVLDDKPARLNVTRLYECLREGHSILLKDAERFHRPLGNFIEDLEGFFHENMDVQVWMAFGEERAADWHLDPDDQFILQVRGKKGWSISNLSGITMDTLGELQDRNIEAREQGTVLPELEESIVWSGELEAGDLLYLPRNTLHLVQPLGEPTMHLTIGVDVTDGIALLETLKRKLEYAGVFGERLPRFASVEDRKAHEQKLLTTLTEVWNDDILDLTLRLRDENAAPIPRFNLIEAAYPDTFLENNPAGDNTVLRWLPVSWTAEPEEGNLLISARGMQIELDEPLDISLAQRFMRERSQNLGDLVALGSEANATREQTINALRDFLQYGLISIER